MGKPWLGITIIGSLTIIAVCAMVTGHDGQLLSSIVAFIAGLGAGGVVTAVEAKT